MAYVNTVHCFQSQKSKVASLSGLRLLDDRRLSARIILPANAEQEPVPAILEYLPFRQRDGRNVSTRTESEMSCDVENIYFVASIVATDDAATIFRQEFREQVKRDNV